MNKKSLIVDVEMSKMPKIEMPIDPDILIKHKWDSLDKIKEFHKNLENEMAKDDPNSGNWIKENG